jgi:tetratricopeptide (TPR) repeat protein
VAHANLGIVYYRARRYNEAVQQMRQVLSLDPNYMLAHLNVGLILSAQGSFDEAAAAFERAIGYAPEFTDALGLLGYAYGTAGKTLEARAVGDRLRQLSSTRYVSGYVLSQYHLGLGEREQALAELERAYEDRSWLIALLKVDPLYDELRGEPRFQALFDRLKFPR